MFIITPRIGLCNQLQTITKGILLAIKYNRNVYIHKFQIDLTSEELADINDILNIDAINHFLQHTVNTPTRILDTIDTTIIDALHMYHLPTIDYANISSSSYINDVIDVHNDMEIIFLGNIVSLDIYTSFACKFGEYMDTNLYYVIMNNISFHQTFHMLKDQVKRELNLTSFNCIHLRIEDDAIRYFSQCYAMSIEEYNTKLLTFYEDSISRISKDQKNIYICSGMLEFDNIINLNYYNHLLTHNPLLRDKKNIKIDNYYLHNRELIAIVDLLLALDSDVFVGCHISSFSQVIHTHHKYHNKETTIFI